MVNNNLLLNKNMMDMMILEVNNVLKELTKCNVSLDLLIDTKGIGLIKNIEVAGVILLQEESQERIGNFNMFMMSIMFPKETLVEFYSQTIGFNVSYTEYDLADFSKEVLNIAFGVIDIKLREYNYCFKAVFPRAYTKDNMENLTRICHEGCVVYRGQQKNLPFFVVLDNVSSLNEDWFDLIRAS